MSDTTKSLRPLVNRAPCWESEHKLVITFFTQERAELTRWGLSLLDLFHTLQIYKPGVSR